MTKKVFMAIGLIVVFGIGFFMGHLSSPDAHTNAELSGWQARGGKAEERLKTCLQISEENTQEFKKICDTNKLNCSSLFTTEKY